MNLPPLRKHHRRYPATLHCPCFSVWTRRSTLDSTHRERSSRSGPGVLWLGSVWQWFWSLWLPVICSHVATQLSHAPSASWRRSSTLCRWRHGAVSPLLFSSHRILPEIKILSLPLNRTILIKQTEWFYFSQTKATFLQDYLIYFTNQLGHPPLVLQPSINQLVLGWVSYGYSGGCQQERHHRGLNPARI